MGVRPACVNDKSLTSLMKVDSEMAMPATIKNPSNIVLKQIYR